MNYKQQYEKAKRAGKVTNKTPRYIKFDKPNIEIIGAYLSVNTVPSRLGDKDYNQYLFDTDEGMVKFAMGKNADNEMKAVFYEGGIFAIKYLGQEKLNDGKHVNKFEVFELGSIDEPNDLPKPSRKPKRDVNEKPDQESIESSIGGVEKS